MDSIQIQVDNTSKQMSTRLDPQTGKYNMKPLDPDYFNKYYHRNNVKTQCVYCDKMIGKLKMYKHHRTLQCMRAQIALTKDVDSAKEMQLEELRKQFTEFLRQHPI